MTHPTDTDPFTAMAAAAEHIRQGVPEVELEWWAEPSDPDALGEQRRLTITLRQAGRHTVMARAAAEADVLRILKGDGTLVAERAEGDPPLVVPPEWGTDP